MIDGMKPNGGALSHAVRDMAHVGIAMKRHYNRGIFDDEALMREYREALSTLTSAYYRVVELNPQMEHLLNREAMDTLIELLSELGLVD